MAAARKRTSKRTKAAKTATKTKRLTRAKNPMPKAVLAALKKRGLLAAYKARPAFQQNDYLGWIARAVREETRQKRIDQMLDELDAGNVYMKMKWNGATRRDDSVGSRSPGPTHRPRAP